LWYGGNTRTLGNTRTKWELDGNPKKNKKQKSTPSFIKKRILEAYKK
jgi:hypothetical protein